MNLDNVRWAAKRTIAMHAEEPTQDRATGRCAQCQPDGSCPQLLWAQTLAVPATAARRGGEPR